MPDLPAAYDDARCEIADLTRPLAFDAERLMVPACPNWSVKDLVAHLQHVSVEYAAGRHEYSTQDDVEFAVAWSRDRPRVDAWAQRGVDARRDLSLEGLLDDWAATSPALHRMMVGDNVLPDGVSHEFLGWAALSDLAIHYQDIRGALGAGPDPQSHAAQLSYAVSTMMLVERARATPGTPALRIVTQRGETTFGEGEPTTIEVDWFEF
jgi:uncharacterized protein (TIGR03083 family)